MNIDIKQKLKEMKMSMKELSIFIDLPYSTLNDIANEKVDPRKCSYETLYKIATFFNMTVDDMMYTQTSFRTFRNNLHHEIAHKTKEEILLDIIENNTVDYYVKKSDYVKALYILSLVDTFCQDLGLPLIKEYSELRNKKLEEPFQVGDTFFKHNENDYLPEFKKHNILEGNLYDAI